MSEYQPWPFRKSYETISYETISSGIIKPSWETFYIETNPGLLATIELISGVTGCINT